MPEMILDYKASLPSTQTGTMAVPLPISPANLQLADLGIFIVPPIPALNRVELKGTVGLQATANTPVVTLRIFRLSDGVGAPVEIFNKQLRVEVGNEVFYTASFSTADFNVTASTGFIVYRLTGETSGAAVNVIGPVTFTGLAIGNLD